MFSLSGIFECCAWGVSNYKGSCNDVNPPCNIQNGALPAVNTDSVVRSTNLNVWTGETNYWSFSSDLNVWLGNKLMYQNVQSLSYPYLKSFLDQGLGVTLVLEFWDSYGNLWALANGSRDFEIIKFFSQVRQDGRKIRVRLLHEMNGCWYPWCIYSGGSNSKDAYVAAFRHISTVIRNTGANVIIQQAYNSLNVGGGDSFQSMYAGDNYVDEITVSAYNFCGAHSNNIDYIDNIINPWYEAMVSITSKPLGISEVGTTGQCGIDKAGWIKDTMYKLAKNYPRIITIGWFLENKGSEDLGLNDWIQKTSFRDSYFLFHSITGWSAADVQDTPPTPSAADIASLDDAYRTYQDDLRAKGINTPVVVKAADSIPLHLDITPNSP
jgi:hypothetical protein